MTWIAQIIFHPCAAYKSHFTTGIDHTYIHTWTTSCFVPRISKIVRFCCLLTRCWLRAASGLYFTLESLEKINVLVPFFSTLDQTLASRQFLLYITSTTSVTIEISKTNFDFELTIWKIKLRTSDHESVEFFFYLLFPCFFFTPYNCIVFSAANHHEQHTHTYTTSKTTNAISTYLILNIQTFFLQFTSPSPQAPRDISPLQPHRAKVMVEWVEV